MPATQSTLRDTILTTTWIAFPLLAVLLIELTPPKTGPVTVVTLPFLNESAQDVIEQAEGQILSLSRWPWIAVGINTEGADFRKKLKAAGAWLLLPSLADGCVKARSLTKDKQ
jgi:hypothetical protein